MTRRSLHEQLHVAYDECGLTTWELSRRANVRELALTRHSSFDKTEAAMMYRQELVQRGLEVITTLLDKAYLVRHRLLDSKRKSFTATTEAEGLAIKQRIESEQYHKLFVDYSQAHQKTLSDLVIRYLEEDAPRTKGSSTGCTKSTAGFRTPACLGRTLAPSTLGI